MKKYWTIFKLNLQVTFAYRASFVVWFFISIIQTLFLLYLWFSIYDSGGKVGNYEFSELLTYYILQFTLYGIIETFISWDIIEDIKEGYFTHYVVKPVNYFILQSVQNFSSKIIESIFALIGFLAILFIAFRYVLPPVSISALIHMIILIFLAMLLSFLIEFLIGISAFWLTDSDGFKMLTMGIGRFFSGNLIPLSLLPFPFILISKFLPFQYLMYVPAQIYLGKTNNIAGAYAGVIIWIAIFFVLSFHFLKVGRKRYESVGG